MGFLTTGALAVLMVASNGREYRTGWRTEPGIRWPSRARGAQKGAPEVDWRSPRRPCRAPRAPKDSVSSATGAYLNGAPALAGPVCGQVVARADGKGGTKSNDAKRSQVTTFELDLSADASGDQTDGSVPAVAEPDVEVELGDIDVEGTGPPPIAEKKTTIEDTVLVLDLRPVEISPPEAKVVTTVLAELLATRPDLRVVTADDVKVMARQQQPPHLLACRGDDCQAPMAQIAAATLAVTGYVGRVDQKFVVSLRSHDIETGKPGGTGTRLTKTRENILLTLPGLLDEVFGWGDGGAVTEDRFMLPANREFLVAVLNRRPRGVDARTANLVARHLAAELRKIPGITVMNRGHVDRLAAAELASLRVRCPDENRCLGEIGLALKVDKVVVCTPGKLGNAHVISLRLIDVRTLGIENRMYEVVRAGERELAPAIGIATRRLIGRLEDDDPGALILSANTPANVILDDQDRGVLPLLLHSLSPGRHTLRLSTEGFVEWSSDVYIEPGKTKALTIELEAIHTPPAWYQKWWVWVSVGAVVVVGVTLGTAFYVDSATKLPVTTGGNHQI